MRELKIDPELRDLLPPLTNEEYKQLEKNIIENGFDKNFPIMEWHGFIVDGHNRYSICKKHGIDYVVGTLAYETKEEVMEWMLDIQLGRRNLSPIQRIAVAEKYRPIYERLARENLRLAEGGDRRSKEYIKNQGVENLPQVDFSKKERNPTTSEKLSDIAGVSEKTYRMGAKVLNSDNEDIKQRVLSGETSISAGYKELQNESKKTQTSDNLNGEYNNELITTSSQKAKVSDEVRQICEDLKTEKSKEYLDSIWDYKVSIIECMNADFETYYDGFVSILNDMEARVTKAELDESIVNAENNVMKLLTAIESAKKTTLKKEN